MLYFTHGQVSFHSAENNTNVVALQCVQPSSLHIHPYIQNMLKRAFSLILYAVGHDKTISNGCATSLQMEAPICCLEFQRIPVYFSWDIIALRVWT